MSDKIDPLLMESPYSGTDRLLSDEPLTPEDWHQVYDAHRAFIAQVRMIVVKARTRRAENIWGTATCPMCHQPQTTLSCDRREHWGVQ